MRYTKIIIEGFNRVSLSNISYINYSPLSKLQIILGTNGSGKTSLLRELSPLPSSKNYWNEDGYKEIHIEHNNKEYIITSRYSKQPKYSFICNGEELNQSGTKAMQLEFIKEHFNLTPDIQQIMTGERSFTQMGVASRKDWFTLIMDNDYSYAITIYNSLKNKLREMQANIKFLNNKYIEVKHNDIDNELLQQIAKDIEVLKSFYNKLIASKKQTDVKLSDINLLLSEIDTITTKVNDTKNRLLSIDIDIPTIDNQIADLEKRKASVQYSIDQLQDTIKKDIEQIQSLGSGKDMDVESIDNAITKLTKEIEDLNNSLPYTLPNIPITDIISSITDIYPKILENVTGVNFEIVSRRSQISTELENTNKDIQTLEKEISALNAKLEHMERHKDDKTKCPKCSHEFSPHYDEEQYQSLHKRLIELTGEHKQLSKAKKDLESDAELINKTIDVIKYIKTLMDSNKMLSSIWSYIFSDYNSVNIVDRLQKLNKTIDTLSSIHSKKQELEDFEKAKEYSNLNTKGRIDEIRKRIAHNEQLLSNNIKMLEDINAKLSILSTAKELRDSLSTNRDRLIDRLRQYRLKYNNYLESIRNQYINDTIIYINKVIAEKEKQLHNADSVKRELQTIEEDIKKLTDKKRLIQTMIDVLSPKDGLIAKSIMYSINTFIDHMNEVIGRIWTYPLQIMPCRLDKDNHDLTYRFPVIVSNSSITDDVSQTSSSMQEVIDTAFKIVSAQYLKLIPCPIYLDEFAKAFDSEHRRAAYRMVRELVNDDDYSQIFMVSHYMEQYANLPEADIVVLNEDNVDIPPGIPVNDVIEIKRQ